MKFKKLVPAVFLAGCLTAGAETVPDVPNIAPGEIEVPAKVRAEKQRALRDRQQAEEFKKRDEQGAPRKRERPAGQELPNMRRPAADPAMTGEAPQSMLIRMFENPDISGKLDIEQSVRDEITAAFKEIDESVVKVREELVLATRKQTEAIATKAGEQEVVAAVEEVGKHRTEIAKLQTKKLMILRNRLSDKDIKALEAARRAYYTERRRQQLQTGEEGARPQRPEGQDGPRRNRGGDRPGRPNREAPANADAGAEG